VLAVEIVLDTLCETEGFAKMRGMEAALSELETKVAEAQKTSDALAKALKKLRQAADTGNVAELEKGLLAISDRGREAEASARALASAWDFDAKEHLTTGYPEELRQEAAAQGLKLFEKDGRLYAFPLLLRIEARDGAVRVGKKLERRIRPKHLVKLIAAIQKRPQRFREERFLALLYEVYRQIAGEGWRRVESGPGPAISLSQVHELMTLLPGADYPVEEFGRDLLLLDRQPDLRTRDGASFEFPGSTLSKGGMKRVTVYDEDGLERTYIAIRFVKGR
jgi:hypothetical protein